MMKFPWENSDDETNGGMLEHRYGDRRALGEEWLEKRKIADKNRLREDGSPNPHHPRMVLEEQMARVIYDMAYLVEANRILVEQNEMFSSMFHRMAVLEGAYSYLRTSTDHVKQEYYAQQKKLLEERKAALKVKPIDKNQPKGDTDHGSGTGTEG